MLLKAVLPLFYCCVVLGYPEPPVVGNGTPLDRLHSNIRYGKSDSRHNPEENTKKFWYDKSDDTLNLQRKRTPNTNVAKNVIMFLGDGMSIPTLAAARVYLAQQLGLPNGEELNLSFEKFPYSGLSKTYCVNQQVADSACSATAYLGGVKANDGTIGVTAAVPYGGCSEMANQANHVDSIGRLSQLAGKRTGVVTTTRVTHASPSGVFGHTSKREWESDADIINDAKDPKVCRDLAYQLVHFDTGANVNVFLAGGYVNFIPKDKIDPFGSAGRREDNIDLIEEWKISKGNLRHTVVTNRAQMLNIKDDTEFVLGLFASSDMPYNLERIAEEVPSLAEMTESAIKLLSKDDDGFFLFVEGGRIDHAHHETKARVALDETVEMNKAIQKALSMVNTNDTLIVVTADHAHTMSISGYPARGHDLLNLGGISDKDHKHFTTISYANGPGYRPDDESGRVVPTKSELDDKFARYPAIVPLSSETHGGDDVGIFSIGPYSHFLDRVVEQNFIARVMMYASCVGDGLTACNDEERNKDEPENGASHSLVSVLLISVVSIYSLVKIVV